MFALDGLAEHKVNCKYGQLTCPANKLRGSIRCDWIGIYSEVKNHLMKRHECICTDYGKEELRHFSDSTSTLLCNKFVFVDNEVFFRHFFWVDGMLGVVVLYIGPPDNAAKYKYKVEFANTDNTEGITVMHLTKSFIEDVNDIFQSGNCGKLHNDVVRRLATQEGALKCKVEILRV
jgi:hypothetical protein